MLKNLKKLLNKQQEYINDYFNLLDLKETEKILNLLLQCKGTIFFSGVGKSGLIAKKIAVTLISVGTRALYLSPTGAVHGDLGLVSQDDIFIMLSKSGESDELLHLVPSIRNKGATLIAIVCNPSSRLAANCHYAMTLPFQKELCPFDMAPTMSTAIQLLFGDLLTVFIMEHKKFSLDEYALNHPSGRIGKRITLKVKDLMLIGPLIPFCAPTDKVVEVLVELSNKRCGCVLIKDEHERLLGIFTDGDLRRSLQIHGAKILEGQMSGAMTANPRCVSPDMLAWEAMKIMEANYQRRMTALPVVDENNHILGLLHLHDIIQSGV